MKCGTNKIIMVIWGILIPYNYEPYECKTVSKLKSLVHPAVYM